MNNKAILIILGTLILILAGILFLYTLYFALKKRKNVKRRSISLDEKSSSKNTLFFLYRIYRQTPLLRRYLYKLKNTYRASTPIDEIILNKKATWALTKVVLLCLGLLTAVLLLGNKDIPYMIVALLVCYILFTNLINRTEEKLQIELLEQLDILISEHNASYENSHLVDESLDEILDDLPYEIAIHGNMISKILHSPEVDLKIEEYMELAPNKYLLLYTAICASILENGDKKLDSGRSLFTQSLDYLKEEVGNETINLKNREFAFSGKVFSVLIPLLLLKPIELWAVRNMPEIQSFFGGSLGVIMLAIVMVATFICYELINILKDSKADEEISNELYEKIASVPIIKKYYNAWINKNYTKALRIQDSLKSVGSKDSIQIFFTKKFVLAILVLIISLGINIYYIHDTKSALLSDYSDAFSGAIVPNDEYREIMRSTAIEYKSIVKSHPASIEDVKEKMNVNLPNTYKTVLAKEIFKRSKEYQEKYYKAYMLIISIALTVISFYIPDLLLSYKKKTCQMAREDEVARFRTLIIILMHQPGMTIDTVFEWLERFSHAFKPSITDCILLLKKDEEKALKELREKEMGFAPFRRLCDSFLNADRCGLEVAFHSLEVDRYIDSQKRKEKNHQELVTCNERANFLVFIPIFLTIFLYCILPIILYAGSMWSEMKNITM